jgi:Cd2+/Zn2+-exporting ATPase
MAHAGNTAEQGPKKYRIAGMDCGNCALTIEASLGQLAGIEAVTVSFTTETMEVLGDVGADAISHRLAELGYKLADDEPQSATLPEHRGILGFSEFLWAQPVLRRAVFVTGAVLIGLVPLAGRSPVLGIAPLDLLFAAAVLIAGGPVFIKGIRAMVFARRITIDLLMAIAAIGALAIGATGEAVTVILLFTLGEALEAYSAERARNSLRSMMALQPQEATVLRAQDDSKYGHDDDERGRDHQVITPVEQVRIGDRVLVRPGQRIPVDGEISRGISSVNQAPVTGENMPVVKTVDDAVMAGTVNGEAALEIRVTRVAADGTIARIAKLVEQAQAQRSPAERYIDRFARWYTPAVVLLAAMVVAIPVLAFGQPLLDSTDGSPGWLYRGLAMLIIACPCALVISIPVTVVSGLTRLANLGVLVKSGAQLDRLADIRTVAFDKTGTLTHGRPIVSGVLGADCEHPPANDADCESCDDIVDVAAAVERASEHPVADAIVSAAAARSTTNGHTTARSVRAHPGLGVCGELGDGTVAVGNRNLFDAGIEGLADIAPYAENAQFDGQTVLYVARNNKVVGYIGVRDEIRRVTGDSLRALEDLDPPVRTVMLTGDSPQAAQRVVDEIGGIDQVRAGLLPEEKLRAIEELQLAMGPIAMVGDGINDAPALARADVGIAMGGGGTAQAMETADVVLMQDDLSHVPMTLQMARKSRRLIKENIALSLGLKIAFLALAIPGFATLWMAVLADVGATLIVTLNGMRLLRS